MIFLIGQRNSCAFGVANSCIFKRDRVSPECLLLSWQSNSCYNQKVDHNAENPTSKHSGKLLTIEKFIFREILTKIVKRSADILNVKITEDAAIEIATRSRGTPRIANQYVKRVRDFAQVQGSGNIDLSITETALSSLHVDKNGLNRMDKRILNCIIDKFNGGPVGLSTIATAVAEESDTLEEVIEPFLIQQGYLERTPRGRQVTKLAYEYLGKSFPGSQQKMF